MTKVDIISGFLGAGKTTFIKKLINQVFAGEKLVLIENEFGEIGIDGGFLKDAGVEITEMNSGCICCTLVGDFSKALQKVLEDYHPDRVIIEPSGVGKLSDVIRAVESVNANAEIAIEGRIAVVDGKKAKSYLKNFGEFYRDQIAHASTIVISRTQLMTDAQVEECVRMLRGENQDAAIISTPWDKLGQEAVLHAFEKDRRILDLYVTCGCGSHHNHQDDHIHECCDHHDHHAHHDHGEHTHHSGCCDHHDGSESHTHHPESHSHNLENHSHDHHGHHHADEVFTSWGKETAHRYTEGELEQIVKELADTSNYGTILRAKGIVELETGEWKQFDFVPGEIEMREGQADYAGRICVIGTDLKETKLQTLFHVL